MKLVLAEKPSVGRTLAAALGCRSRANGYIEGNGYVVTWALGHLIELAPPASYGTQYKRWSLASLPILPQELKKEPIEDSRQQFDVVKALMQRSDIDGLIIATDAGREGELVARWIMEEAGWKGKTERLWISSQTDAAIKEGFANLKDGDGFLDLFHAAESRSAADWYVGMNVSRALTCRFDARMSAGRVQTPTLKILCDREEEIEKFEGSFYWTLKGDFDSFQASLYPTEDSVRITEENEARRLMKELEGKAGKVTKIDHQERREAPPLAYDLTELQRDANTGLGFSAKKTLDVLQRLYEVHKIVTYPRTDSRYLTHDIVPTFPDRLLALSNTELGPAAIKLLHGKVREDLSRLIQDDKVSDHHALLPTEQKVDLSRFSEDEKALWKLVAVRFLEVLLPDYVYVTTTAEITVGGYRFVARSTDPVALGWKQVSSNTKDEHNEDGMLAKLAEGDAVQLGKLKLRRMAVEAPHRYSDATLLSAMEHAGRFVEDEQAKKYLGAGLGTPATRADIIEKLISNHYVDRNGQNELVPTARGRETVRLAPQLLRSPELTGKWEDRLAAISKGKDDWNLFVEDIKEVTRTLVGQIKVSHDRYAPDFKESKECPYCHSLMMKIIDEQGAVHFVCQKLSCGYEEKIVSRRVPLSEDQLAQKRAMLKKEGKVMTIHKVSDVRVPAPLSEEVKIAASVSSSAAYFSNLGRQQPKPVTSQPVARVAGKVTVHRKTNSETAVHRKVVVRSTVTPVNTVYVDPFETRQETEVVRQSRLDRSRPMRKSGLQISLPKDSIHRYHAEEEQATFADYIRVSEKRDHKKRK